MSEEVNDLQQKSKLLSQKLVELRNGSSQNIPIRGRDLISDPWVLGEITKRDGLLVVKYTDGDEETYSDDPKPEDGFTLAEEVSCGFIEMIEVPRTDGDNTSLEVCFCFLSL